MQLSFFRADDIRPYAGAVRIRPKRYDRPVHAARAIHDVQCNNMVYRCARTWYTVLW